jgi:virulence factor
MAAVERLQSQYHLSGGTTDVRALLEQKPQAAFVLTTNEQHRDLVAQLLQAGVDVFVEKPATIHSSEIRELAELADARGRVLQVSFNRRYAPLHQQARELWGDRPVGLCVVEKYRPGAAHSNLFANYIDDTIHLIDLLRFFCGDGEAVSTVQQVRDGKLLGALSTVLFPSGGHGVVATCLDAGRWRECYELHGGGASMYVEAFTQVRLVTPDGERVWSESGGDWTPMLVARGFAAQIERFFECVQSRQQPLTSGWEAFKTQRLLEDMVARAVA